MRERLFVKLNTIVMEIIVMTSMSEKRSGRLQDRKTEHFKGLAKLAIADHIKSTGQKNGT